MLFNTPTRRLVPGLLLVLLLYAFGLGGIFFIDDAPTLDGLLAVGDWISAGHYVFSGDTGPLGRPLALFTFLLQADSYPQSAKAFLAVNILLHVANVLVLALVLCRLQRLAPRCLGESPWFAPATAVFWGLLPILASASLMVVQRMTVLSALFVLLGMLAYLWTREQQRWLRLGLGVFAIGLCTLLAALAKENGALLPLLLLVMHGLLLFGEPQTRTQPPVMRRTLILALALPSLLLLGYMASRVPGIAGSYAWRPFTLDERLATQPIILWEYLREAFFPRVMGLSPYRDDYPIWHFSDGASQLAIAAWLGVLAAGAVLRWRARPLLLFAVAWFLVGHLLESGMFALFLYFEHRNYVPLIGPVIVISAVFARLPLPVLAQRAVAGAYLAFLALVLWQTTSMWGQRQQLVWAAQHPDSVRALQMLAAANMQAGRVPQTQALYRDAWTRHPEWASAAIQGLRASCYLPDGGAAAQQWLPDVHSAFANGQFSHLTISALDAVGRLAAGGQCHGVSRGEVEGLVATLGANPLYADTTSRAQLHGVRVNLYLSEGQRAAAIAELRQVMALRPDIETLRALHGLVREEDGAAAAAQLSREVRIPPDAGWFGRRIWQREIDAMNSAQ